MTRSAPHSEAIKASLDRFCAVWQTNDGATLAGFYVEDGSLINPFGGRADGRHAVAAMYTDYFGGLLRGTTTTMTLGSVRPVSADYAFIDAEQPITTTDGRVVLTVHLAALVRRDSDEWRFVDARPYTVPPPQ